MTNDKNICKLKYAQDVVYNPDSAIDEEGVAKDMAIKGLMSQLEEFIECKTEGTQVVCSICMPYVRSEVIIDQLRYNELLATDNDKLQERIEFLSKPWWKKLWK